MSIVYGDPSLCMPDVRLSNGAVVPHEAHGPLMPLTNTAEAILATPYTLQEALRTNRDAIDNIAHQIGTRSLNEVVAIGSGDSLRVGEFAADCLAAIVGVRATTVNALTYSRRGFPFGHPWLLGMVISSTGRQGEATAALERAREDMAMATLGMVATITDAPDTSPYASMPNPDPIRSDVRYKELTLRPNAIGPHKTLPTRTTMAGMTLAADLALAVAAERGVRPASVIRSWRDDVLRGDLCGLERTSRDAIEWVFDVTGDLDPDSFVMNFGEGSDFTVAKMADTLMAAGPQVPTAALELGESDHALRLAATPPGGTIVLVATEGITGRHAELFRNLEAEGRRPLLIGTFVGAEAADDIRGNRYIFEAPFLPRPMGALHGAVVAQWLALALAVRRIDHGYQRVDRIHAISPEALKSHMATGIEE